MAPAHGIPILYYCSSYVNTSRFPSTKLETQTWCPMGILAVYVLTEEMGLMHFRKTTETQWIWKKNAAGRLGF